MDKSQIIEMERKFLVLRDDVKKLIKDNESSCNPMVLQEITQNYLFNENASLFYDVDSSKWFLTLKVGAESKEFEMDEISPKLGKEILGQHNGKDLLFTKCAARIRLIDDLYLFTFKKPVSNGNGDYEFEFSIPKEIVKDPFFKKFMKKDKFKVIKVRYTISIDGLKYEIDSFKNVNLKKRNSKLDLSVFGELSKDSLMMLEVEFNSKEIYESFNPIIKSIDVTNEKGFGNKSMARENGLK